MVRDTVERNIVDPTPSDILAVRREAAEAVIKIGAVPETVEVQIEVDTRRNVVRATAFGTTELRKDNDPSVISTLGSCKAVAAKSLQAGLDYVQLEGKTTAFYVFSSKKETKMFFGLFRKTEMPVRIVDKTGVIRLQRSHAHVTATTVADTLPELDNIIGQFTDFGDAGRSLPDIHVLVGARIINLSGLADVEQALALAKTELENLPSTEGVVIIAAPK
jgi:hypothetical protein